MCLMEFFLALLHSLRQHYFTLLIGPNCYAQHWIFAAFSTPNSDPTLRDHIKVLKISQIMQAKITFFWHFTSFKFGLLPNIISKAYHSPYYTSCNVTEIKFHNFSCLIILCSIKPLMMPYPLLNKKLLLKIFSHTTVKIQDLVNGPSLLVLNKDNYL